MILDKNDSSHFQFFAEQVKEGIARFGKMNKEEFIENQRKQVDGLADLELAFIQALRDCNRLKEAFDCFYDYIINERKNLLVARPFFRERATKFSKGIMASIKERQYEETAKYHLNFHFVDLVVKKVDFSQNEEVLNIHKKIVQLRKDLVLMNIPLIISRARIFYSRTPRSHLSFMDLVQIGMGGLLAGIDKYAGKYERIWRGVVIGRCTGDLISHYSHTSLHFYPEDRKRLYRANKYLARVAKEEVDDVEMLRQINFESEKKAGKNNGKKANVDDIRNLLQAASLVSVDIRPSVDDEQECDDNISRIAGPDESRPDCAFELDEGMQLMVKTIKTLPLIDQKILRLKGIEFEVGNG
jgi:hypothetical protein